MDTVPWRRTLQLDQIVIRAVRRKQRTRMLKVLALGVALERFLARLMKPIRKEDAPVGGRRVRASV